MIEFKYGAYLMQDPAAGKVVVSTDIDSSPVNDVQIDSLADADGGLVVKQQFKPKTFTINGFLRAQTRAEARLMKDAFKTAMAQKNKALDVTDEGVVRRYLANAINVAIADRGLTSIGFSVQFVSADGMGWNVETETALDAEAITGSSHSFPLPLVGSYMVEPQIRLEFSSVSGATNKSVTIIEGSTLRGLKITRTWAANDVIEIDSLKKQVFVNSVPADFSGQFPTFEPGSAVISYLDDFTGRAGVLDVTYTPRWL